MNQAPAQAPSTADLMLAVQHLEDSLEDAQAHLMELQSAAPASPDPATFDDVATLTQARTTHAAEWEQHQLRLQSAGDLITTLSERLAAKRAELEKATAADRVSPDLSKFLATGRRFKKLLAEAEACFDELQAEADRLLADGYRDAFPRDRRSAGARSGPLTISGWPEHRRWPYVLVGDREVAIGSGDYSKHFAAEENADLTD